MLKRSWMVIGVVALLLTLGLGGVWAWGQGQDPVVAQETDYSPAQTITVVGQGTVKVEPDIARVSVGVETAGESVSEAVAENGAKMESILAALESAGVDEKDIQTTNYSIQLDRYPEPMPRADLSAGESQPQPQYRVSNMVNVVVRDLESVADVLDAVIEAGANNIWGVSFSLEDPVVAQAEARTKAVGDAQERAEALAELSSVELGPVMSISEVVSGGVFPAGVAMERSVAAAGPISPGEMEIGYQLQVSYFIER